MLLASLVCLSFDRTGDQAIRESLWKRDLKRGKINSESICVWEKSSRIVDHHLVMPLSMPIVFSVHSYVHAARMLPLDRDWDGGQIALELLTS